MGQDVETTEFSGKDRQRYRAKVRRCLDVFSRMLSEAKFEFDRPMTGLEIELNLVDEQQDPAMRNADVLNAIANDQFQTELGQFNIEINLPPRVLGAHNFDALEAEIRSSLNDAEEHARELGARMVMIGILPTLRPEHLTREALSANPRYALINEQIFQARGEDLHISIDGVERLSTYADTIAPEAACTSVQFHLQVSPQQYPAAWNAAQAIAGVQVALGANSPFLFGKELWRETRIALFEQATDTRPEELKAQGVRPRVWFGERWITSVLDLFAENGRYFPGLMPITEDTDPMAELAAGRVPQLDELRLHNGTIWRWNRPVYDVAGGVPHVRVENRVLPAGPTAIDMVANALFFYGLLRVLVEAERPLWSSMSFEAVEENFTTAARHGMDGPLYWPGSGWIRPDELVLRKLLPQAAEGLTRWGVAGEVIDRYLSVIERRCATRRTGAAWQLDAVAALEAKGADRPAALRRMLSHYLERSAANAPVHAWPLP